MALRITIRGWISTAGRIVKIASDRITKPTSLITRVDTSGTVRSQSFWPLARARALVEVSCSRFLQRVGRPDLSIRAAVRAVNDNPAIGASWIRYGNALLAGGLRAPAVVSDVGITDTYIADPTAAAEAFDRAVELAPLEPEGWVGRGRSLTLANQHSTADEAFRTAISLDQKNRNAWFFRARMIEARARRRGALLESEVLEIEKCWTQTLRSSHTDQSARYHLVRHYLAIGDFDEAVHAAWESGPRIDLRSEDAVANVSEIATKLIVPDEWLFAVHSHLLGHGRVVDAFETKRLLAVQASERVPRVGQPIRSVLAHARALSWLGLREDALDGLRRPSARLTTRTEQLSVEKLRHDIELWDNRTSRFDEPFVHLDGLVDAIAEHRFREMIHGRRVAIVGPAKVDHEPDLDRFDTVVRTKHTGALAHLRTDIAYFSDANAMLSLPSIVGSLGRGDLTLAVFRPSLLAVSDPKTLPAGRVRFMRSEDSNTFFASRFGIQRIIYDILQYAPTEIDLFGLDFFLGPELYRSGYADDTTTPHRPGLYQAAKAMSVHDYRSDFLFTKRLVNLGVVRAAPDVQGHLALDEHSYLQKLQPLQPLQSLDTPGQSLKGDHVYGAAVSHR